MLEIAVVMIIIGILTGGGVSLMKLLTERKAASDIADAIGSEEIAKDSGGDAAAAFSRRRRSLLPWPRPWPSPYC